jgi:L-lactate dehydrogenase complex protein LldG
MNDSKEIIIKKIAKERPFSKLLVKSNVEIYSNKSTDLLKTFIAEINKVNGNVIVCNNFKDAQQNVLEYIKNNNIEEVYTFIDEIIELLNTNEIKASNNFNANIQASVTYCEYLSARTGTVIVSSNVTGRRLNIFAPTHIVIAKKSQLVNDIAQGLEKIKNKYDSLPTLISYITGPSRTADIEKTLIIGAHGPKKLIVFIYND